MFVWYSSVFWDVYVAYCGRSQVIRKETGLGVLHEAQVIDEVTEVTEKNKERGGTI